ncbi:MAG TPA: phosphatase PAP2 family protein [Candidatus Methylacidiphilales bacterium]|nr:phosphatase PAP2 family protein [Candidatus Methylacidiphilales bacterium]
MKVKHFRAPRRIVAGMAQGRTVLRGCWFLFRTRKLPALGVFAGAAALGALIWPHDPALLAGIHFWRGGQEDLARRIAWYFGTWGDYPTYNVPLALAIWLYGVAAGSGAWRRAAVVCFLGATLAGLFDDCFRLTLGRPRPDTLAHTHIADGFYGITYAFRGGFQSFPSGHAAAVFGAAMALLVVKRPLGIAATLFAFAVVWARMELDRHNPSDVVVGSIIGIYFGLLAGFGAKVRLPRPMKTAGP